MYKFDHFFSKSEKKKNPIHVPYLKKIHRLERAQYAFLDHSKILVFRDVIKIELLQVTVLRKSSSNVLITGIPVVVQS